ncbi:hypothetical protein HY388_01890 [Candidatus Daviesbacteria bacterium]|nr:hypothetical protein [Candidatus Daviesbacteria bacterium]
MSKKSSSSCCLDVIDYNKNRIIFHEKRRKEKANTHVDLDDLSPNGFVKKSIPEALVDPDVIWEDLTNPKIRNYYKLNYYQKTRFSRFNLYTKVVVGTWDKPWFILTAYQPQNIKEEKGDTKKCLYQKQ